jgi:isoaspartyl peptidase/L-asparaginase-like protein (Ntn-hydrolase superfamily)
MTAPHHSRTPTPLLLGTWSAAQAPLAHAWSRITAGSALDAVEAACRYAESDLTNHTVGVGGWPDRDGDVSLDAAIMRSPSERGAVCGVRTLIHPISVAAAVMRKTPHALLAGAGADAFGTQLGMMAQPLLTPAARDEWQRWKLAHAAAGKSLDAPGEPMPNFEELRREHPVAAAAQRNEFHDTIGVVAFRGPDDLAAACSTSGLPWKLPGRVGDSPLFGHGLYCDTKAGACVCTGHGELLMGICGSFLAVETLRRGGSPHDAAHTVLQRIVESYPLTDRDQVGLIIVNSQGDYAIASLRSGFRAALHTADGPRMIEPTLVMLSD